LIAAWVWLISGILGMLSLFVTLPAMSAQMTTTGNLPPYAAMLVQCFAIGFNFVLMVVLPGLLVLFYGSKDVKATVERRDTRPRWTDRCPLPVLAFSLLAGCAAVSIVVMSGYTEIAFGFFSAGIRTGTILGDLLYVLVIIAMFGYIAWGAYRLDRRAWWCAVGLFIAMSILAMIPGLRMNPMEMYQKMNMPAQQLEMTKAIAATQPYLQVVYGIVWLGFLFYLKQFFKPASQVS
jgi:hypothetical protein